MRLSPEMKPSEMLKDSQALAEKNKSNYYKRMKKIKYYKLGFKSARKNKSKSENPYKLTPEIVELIRKRTYWTMGFDDGYVLSSHRKKQLKLMAEKPKERSHDKHKHKK